MSTKKFLCCLVALVVLVVAGDRVVGTLMRRYYNNVPTGEVHRLQLIEREVRADVLVMGSSRALHHYVPGMIEQATGLSCYNCGLEAENIITHYALMRAIEQRYEPRVILYEVAHHYDLENCDYTLRLSKLRRMSSLRCRDSILTDIDPWERLRMSSWIYPYNSTLLEMMMERKVASTYDAPDADNGYVPLHGVMDSTRFVWNNENVKPCAGIDPVRARYLKDFIARNRSRLVVLVSPRYHATEATDTLYDLAREMCRRHGVPFVSARSDTAFTRHVELWDDGGHMNDDGARLFTRTHVLPALEALLKSRKQ